MSITIRVVHKSDDIYYNGEIVPPDIIKPYSYSFIPVGYVAASVETDGDCPSCDGFGLCQCDCGDEHDCHYCDGTGIVRMDKTVCLPESFVYEVADREDQDRKIAERYGVRVENISDWWTRPGKGS